MTVYETYLVCYDIANRRRLRRVAQVMEQHGLRLQRSVFVCRLTPARRDRLVARLRRLIEPGVDAVSLYRLCSRCEAATLHLGAATTAPAMPVCLIV